MSDIKGTVATKGIISGNISTVYGKDGKDGRDGIDGIDGKDYVLTEADKLEIAGMVEIPDTDQTFNPTSENAQSGKAVAETIGLKNVVKDKAVYINDASQYVHPLKIKLTSDEVVDFTGYEAVISGKNLISGSGEKIFTEKFNGYLSRISALQFRDKTITMQVTADFTNTIEEDTANVGCRLAFLNENGDIISQGFSPNVKKSTEGKTATITEKVPQNAHKIGFAVSAFFNSTADPQPNSTIRLYDIMAEIGNKATEFQPYVHPLMRQASANGVVEGATSLPECMVITTNPQNESIEITCEYNADTKKYIDNKFAELQAMVLEA